MDLNLEYLEANTTINNMIYILSNKELFWNHTKFYNKNQINNAINQTGINLVEEYLVYVHMSTWSDHISDC